MRARFEEAAEQIGKLVADKNEAYGNSFSEAHHILKVLFPYGIKPEQYIDALAIIRVLDKLFRIANKKDAFGESPWRDIAGYALLGVVNGTAEGNKSKHLSGGEQNSLDKHIKKVKSRKKDR